MAEKFELSAEIREVAGKGASRRLRRLENKIPAIVYGAGKAPASINIQHHHLTHALKNQAFYSHILTLKVNGKEEKVVLKDLQRHPSKPLILHADFLRVSATEKLHMQVPFRFLHEDEAPGVKLEGGQVSHLMNDVEIRCLPSDLPEAIEIDVSGLQIGESIHLSDIKVPHGVEIVPLLHGDDKTILSIHRQQIAEEPEAPVEAPPAEVPVVGEEEKKEGE